LKNAEKAKWQVKAKISHSAFAVPSRVGGENRSPKQTPKRVREDGNEYQRNGIALSIIKVSNTYPRILSDQNSELGKGPPAT
jgi:hypothetical protein